PVPTLIAPPSPRARSYGASSWACQSLSPTPSWAIRYRAGLDGRRPWEAALVVGVLPPTSTIDIEVISADTVGTGARPPASPGVDVTRSSWLVDGAALAGRPASAATYSNPLSSKCSERISSYGESSNTKALPAGSTRSTRPGDSVP